MQFFMFCVVIIFLFATCPIENNVANIFFLNNGTYKTPPILCFFHCPLTKHMTFIMPTPWTHNCWLLVMVISQVPFSWWQTSFSNLSCVFFKWTFETYILIKNYQHPWLEKCLNNRVIICSQIWNTQIIDCKHTTIINNKFFINSTRQQWTNKNIIISPNST